MKNFSIGLTGSIEPGSVESKYERSMEQLMESKRSQDFSDLLALLKKGSDGSYSRVKALYALGRWGDEAAATSICEVIPTLNEIERLTAAEALGRLGSAQALECVLQLKEDPSPHVRKFATRALACFEKA